MPKPKSSLDKLRKQATLRQNIVAELYRHGYTYREIREEVKNRLDLPKYSLDTVHRDVQAILAEWRQMRNLHIEELQQLELNRIDEMMREAWAAWDKSKTDYDKKRMRQYGKPIEGGNGGEGGIETVGMEQSKEEMVMCGDVRYLELINKLSVERRKILGLYAPEKRALVDTEGKDVLKQIRIEVIDRREQINTDGDTDNEGVCRNPIGYRQGV